jgi:hypothetical protein
MDLPLFRVTTRPLSSRQRLNFERSAPDECGRRKKWHSRAGSCFVFAAPLVLACWGEGRSSQSISQQEGRCDRGDWKRSATV